MRRISESRTLLTTADVMKALGGPVAVSKLTGARYKTVWPWGKGKKTFPSCYFVVMTWALRKKRLSAPPSLWGQVTPAEMEKAAA